jgi:hypothetical protein
MTIVLKQRELFSGRWRKVLERDPLEDEIQKTLIQHLHLRCRPGVIYFHIPNGGWRTKITGMWLKLMGVRPGVADLEFNWYAGCVWDELTGRTVNATRVLYLELKARGRKQSSAQRQFQTECGLVGAIYATADNIDDALAILKQYGILQ